jgi:hypothetical protein
VSSVVRIAAGLSLALGGLLNGLPPYIGNLLAGNLDSFADSIEWGMQHPAWWGFEQSAILVSVLFIPLGLLGLAQVTRHRSPWLSGIGIVLALWGMWGFHNLLATGYLVGTTAPGTVGVDAALALNDAMGSDPGILIMGLVPHLVGSSLGISLLMIAALRSRAFSRIACALVLAFIVWDFLLPTFGPAEPHILLVVGWVWLGIQIMRMPHGVWSGNGMAERSEAATA